MQRQRSKRKAVPEIINELRLQELTVRYGRQSLLNHLNGSFARGRINLIVGRAGSGKSTLLRAIAGFHKDYSGRIVAGEADFEPAGNISLVFQNPETLFFNGSVGEEVAYALKMRKMPSGDIETAAKEWLRQWGLSPATFWNRHPLELSGGEKRRVALAACTVFLPPVVLLDEPLAGLDSKGQLALASMLETMATGHIVIVVTHEPETLLSRSGNLLYLRDGSGQWFSPDEFLRQALADDEFFPMPEWYCSAVRPLKDSLSLPLLEAESVYRFLKERRGAGADKL
jgi:energy-coupling factor transporter ATP-binding protein EcfA2